MIRAKRSTISDTETNMFPKQTITKGYEIMLNLLMKTLTACLALMLAAGNAEAKKFRLENASGYGVAAALVMPTNRGWVVRGWFTLPPYSYKTLNFRDAGGRYFGYYARTRNGNVQWRGSGREPNIAIVDNAMNHFAGRVPRGHNARRVKVRIKAGNVVRFTVNAPRQRRNSGWW
jgi:uncharacterized membrane protein